jgi:hypothetical protein
MLTEEDWKNLPEDRELAFAILDDQLWAKVEDAHKPTFSPSGDRYEKMDGKLALQAEHSYVQSIKGFVDETGIELVLDSTETIDEFEWDAFFARFRAKVVYYRARLGARTKTVFFARPGEAVKLSDDFKEDIHDLLNKIRKIIHASDLGEDKKDAIYKKINELNDEVDQTRTKYGRFKALYLDVTETVGEGAKNLEPVVKILDRIAGIFGKARVETDPEQLTGPEPPKQITGPDADAGTN